LNNSPGISLHNFAVSISSHDSGHDGPERYGYSPFIAQYFDSHNSETHQHDEPGRVVRVDRNLVLTAVGSGILHLPYPLDDGIPVTGDWVWIGPNRGGDRQITGILPRRSELSRKRAFEDSSGAQVLAANMDVVGVVDGEGSDLVLVPLAVGEAAVPCQACQQCVRLGDGLLR